MQARIAPGDGDCDCLVQLHSVVCERVVHRLIRFGRDTHLIASTEVGLDNRSIRERAEGAVFSPSVAGVNSGG